LIDGFSSNDPVGLGALAARRRISFGLPAFSARNIPIPACMTGPRPSAAINSASIAICHGSVSWSAFLSFRIQARASATVRSSGPFGSGIGSSKRRTKAIDNSQLTEQIF
jgi:hypothetical protein